MSIVIPQFQAAATRAPSFTKKRPDQRFAFQWVKKRLRAIHRDVRAGRAPELGEPAAHLYLLIATYVLDDQFITKPIEHQELVAVMHCKAAITVTRARERLIERRELELVDGGQGKAHVQFALIEMAGPLYVESGGAAVASGRSTCQLGLQVTSQLGSQVTPPEAVVLLNQIEKLPELVNQSEKFAGALSDLEEEEPPRSSSSDRKPTTVDRFVDWWAAQFPVHNGGVLGTVRDCDRIAAIKLLDGRSLERVQAMSIKIWSLRRDRSRHDRNLTWIVDETDRSIRVLLEKDSYIEQLVVGDEIRAAVEADRQRHIAEQLARRSAPPPEQPADQHEASEPPAAPATAPERMDPAVGWAMVREALNRKCGVG